MRHPRQHVCVCAAEGQPLTLVCTDVEGSTELWEWDSQTMMAAISLHDKLMRSLMAHYHGYEVCTEVRMALQAASLEAGCGASRALPAAVGCRAAT